MGIPVLIFMLCAALNKFIPFGSELLNSYDSFTQYPGMLLEHIRLLKDGLPFYSWKAGLGFNFFGTLTYYCMSPLNLLAVFANPNNYHIFIAIMTFLRFALLGFTMCFYLSHKDYKPLYIVLFSTIYALMGYTCTYYYNFLWIDSVIMLPLVIHGLDKLLEENKPAFYIIALTITIIINYYIGYMICIFSLIWFIYNICTKKIKDKKKLIKTFVISSLLSGLMSMIVIIPSFFALLTGKAELYNEVNYLGANRNILTFFYTFTTGAYQNGDQTYGPALIYVGIISLVLCIMYFYNDKFSKKEKIATLIVLVFFYLSFSLHFLNYAWQFFQQPIWWQSRFSFTFSFFLITIAIKSLSNIEHVKMKVSHRIIISILFIIACLIGAKFKWAVLTNVYSYTYIFLGFSLLIFLEFIFLLDKKNFLTMLLIFTFIEISLNTYNSLKGNYRYKSYMDYQYVKEEVPEIIKRLDEENDSFYRMEFMDDFSSDDGLYFGYNGINYFNSVRNVAPLNLLENLGISVYNKSHIELDSFDPVLMSVFNIKYLYGQKIDYYKEKDVRLFENVHPLSLAFASRSDIKNLKLKEKDFTQNKENLLKSLTGLDDDIYKTIPSNQFIKEQKTNEITFTYNFTADGHYLVIPEFAGTIKVDDKLVSLEEYYKEIKEDEKVTITYNIYGEFDNGDVFITLLDLDAYEKHIKSLEESLMKVKTNKEGHILRGTIDVLPGHDYLFTSVEYEEGMKVYVDGTKITPDIILDSLIGFPIEEGNHEIIIDYVPKGLKSGLIVSTTSLLITIFYLQRKKKEL